MAFLSNRTVNYLNLHLAFVNILDQAYLIFVPLYLYSRGFSVAEVLMLIALFMLARMPMRFLSFPVIRRWGLKVAIMIGAAGYGLSFPLLSLVKGYDGWLLLYILVYATCNSMHWFAFHTFYCLAGEREKRGRQLAVAYAFTSAFTALAPLLSALIIVDTGFPRYFMFAVVLTVCMLITLSRCQTIPVIPVRWREGRKMLSSVGVRIHLMESAGSYPIAICWLFAVYLYLGKMVPLGGVITFGVLVQIVYQLFLGAWVDQGHGERIVHASGVFRILAALGKAFLPLSLPVILGLEATQGAGSVHQQATEPTALYSAGKESKYPLWYWLFTEMAWDTGTVIGAGGAALLLWAGVELRHVMLMSLPFLSVLWWILYTYFAKHHYVRPSA